MASQQLALSFSLLLLSFFVASSEYASAQNRLCGAEPPVADEKLKGDLESKATALSRFFGDLRFKGRVELEKKDALSRYPKANELHLNRLFMYQVCNVVMSDRRLSTARKLELISNARQVIFQPTSKRSEWLQSNSLRLTVNRFRVDEREEYEGVLNFTISNFSDTGLGVGILSSGATAGGCSGDMVATGLPTVAPAREIAFASGTIHMSELSRAPDPARFLRWLPAGGRLSATVRWFLCDAESPTSHSVPVTVPVVLAAGRDVLELSLYSD